MSRPNVIGNGLIARSFFSARFDEEVVLFASGVSNSGETRVEEFDRERSLLKTVMAKNTNFVLVYFSSTSVTLGHGSKYANHKREMEDLVKSHSRGFYIFQLPQVVGVVNNKTLVSYLSRMCLKKETVDIHLNARRNLIGVDDLVRVVQGLVNSGYGLNTVQVLASASNVSILSIVEEISSILGLPLNLRMHNDGDDQSVSVEFLRGFLKPEDPLLNSEYWKGVLRHYVPLLVDNFCE